MPGLALAVAGENTCNEGLACQEDEAMFALQTRTRDAANAVARRFPDSSTAMRLARWGFESDGSGLFVSSGGSIYAAEGPVEPTSVHRKDLPVAVYGAGETTGIIYQPFGSETAPPVDCAYPIDAASNRRTRLTGRRCHGERANDHSGACNLVGLTTPQKYVRYMLQPDIRWSRSHMSDYTCYLKTVPGMVEYQKELFKTIGANYSYYHDNTRRWGGPTLYNEVPIKNHGSDAVLAAFWAHGGAFQDDFGIRNGGGGVCGVVDNRMYNEAVVKFDLTVVEMLATLAGAGGNGYGTLFDRGKDAFLQYTRKPVTTFAQHYRVVPKEVLRKCRSFR